MLIESGISGNAFGDGLKCLADNCQKNNVQAALLDADHFQLGGTPYEIADRLRDNQVAALLDFDSYLHGKMSLDQVLLETVMNRKWAIKSYKWQIILKIVFIITNES